MYTKKNLPKQFDFINHQWKLLLERLQLSEETMPEQQRESMKRAFVGGASQMLICIRDEVTVYPDGVAELILKAMLDKIGDFWDNELMKHNGKLN